MVGNCDGALDCVGVSDSLLFEVGRAAPKLPKLIEGELPCWKLLEENGLWFVFGAPKLKVGTPGFAAAMDGAGDFAFSISSATAAAVLSFCSLFLAKKDAGHFFTAGAGAPDCS